MKSLLSLLLLIAGLLPGPAAADDLIIDRAVLEDPSGQLGVDDLAGRPFEPMASTLTKGYSGAVYWLRLQVKAPAQGRDVVLRITPPFLDEIQLFEPGASNSAGQTQRVTGDRYPFDSRDQASSALGFVVTPAAPQTTYYLRLMTTSMVQLTVQALPPRQAQHQSQRLDMWHSVFAGLMLWVLVWAVQDYVENRQAVVGLFTLYQANFILFGLATGGYLAPFIPEGLPTLGDTLTNVLVCSLSFTFVLFSRALLQLYAPTAWLVRGLELLLLAFPLQLTAMALGYTRLAMASNALLFLACHGQCLWVAAMARKQQVPSLRLLRTGYGVLALLALFVMLSNLRWPALVGMPWVKPLTLISYGLIGSSLTGMMMFTRSRQLRRETVQAAVNLAQSQQALALEHQLKERAEHEAHTDELTGLSNRRDFMAQASRELARAQRYQKPLTVLMIDIDHFKHVNDTWGHALGDVVLRNVAHVSRGALRDFDLLGRIGGEEFAAVLVESETDSALDVAQRLRLAVEASQTPLPDGQVVKVTVSLGLTELRGRTTSMDRLLIEADQAMYQAKQTGRNRVVTFSKVLPHPSSPRPAP